MLQTMCAHEMKFEVEKLYPKVKVILVFSP